MKWVTIIFPYEARVHRTNKHDPSLRRAPASRCEIAVIAYNVPTNGSFISRDITDPVNHLLLNQSIKHN